ncbi:MAG TPA: FkbM family methyltransferase [Xanthobacteraceae bacterium]|nr:FkbM family methyltransferase [Xanthobacteraceae bacterium]
MKDYDINMLRLELRRAWQLSQMPVFRARMSRLRRARALVLQRLGHQRWVKARCFWGEPIQVLTGELVSKGILAFGYHELALTALMIEVLKPGMRFVDVGTHIGYEAMLASRLVGLDGRVVAFEPQGQIAIWAERNLRRFHQARLVQAAVGETEGRCDFTELQISSSAFSRVHATPKTSFGRQYEVPVATIDTTLDEEERPVDFIKIDVEGNEMSVLRGALDVLRKDKPFLVLEAEMPSLQLVRPRIMEFQGLLEPLGYRGLSFDYDGGLNLGPLGSSRAGHANVGFVHSSKMTYLEGFPID